ncbi:MAG TPA: HlyD family efflux transporter periplasmic adaptor subunit [Candidatus Binataceae bacterium]|nr:HlyD family efflux transporter periplasmic adaptor subunit [Candidatus Binataceae bacterium]
MNVQTSPVQKRTGNDDDLAPRSSRKRALLLALVVLAGAGAAVLYWQLSREGVAAGELMVSGNIEAHQSLVSFKDVTSRIVELPFDEGQWVEKGQLIARVDDSNYRQQVAVDEAAVEVQKQQLESAKQTLIAAQHTVVNDQADFAEKDIDAQRYQELWKQNATSAQSRDLADTAMKQSAASLKHDQAMVAVAQQNIAAAAASVKNAEETLRLARITLGYTVLNAPFSGVIVVRQTELGEVMQPGTPVVTLADLDHVWLRAYVSETDLGKIRYGQDATVTTDTYPGKKYPGHITFISSSAEFTPKSVETHQERVTLVYRIKIDIENPNHELKPGMPADAFIELGQPRAEGAINGQPILGH